MLKRGYHGTFHQISHKHIDRDVSEYSYRHNEHPASIIDQTSKLVRHSDGKWHRYEDLILGGVHVRRRTEIAAT